MLRRLVITAGSAVAASLFIAAAAGAQTGVLSGTVVAGEGRAPLAGATVTVVGTGITAVTDSSGRFTIAGLQAGEVELSVRGSRFIPLSDRVRIAAGDTTHAVYELIDPDAERQASRVMLRVPRTRASGAADTTVVSFPTMEARAAGKPLIIVDGVIITTDGDAVIRRMDPKGIEAIEVIKGELAKEKYGERAAGGVIMITTKPGSSPPSPPPPAPPVPSQPPPR